MTKLVIGVGQAGCNVVDAMYADSMMEEVAVPMAINSTITDLRLLRNIQPADWYGLSEADGLVRGTQEGFEGRVTGGFGKDPQLAHDLLTPSFDKIVRAIAEAADAGDGVVSWPPPTPGDDAEENDGGEGGDDAKDPDSEPASKARSATGPKAEIPFALIVAGMGGGTGSGATAIIARAVREASRVASSVILVGILPATRERSERQEKNETRGTHRQAWNAMFALDRSEPHVDGIVLVDNERLSFAGSIEHHFPEYNEYVATALTDLLGSYVMEDLDVQRVKGVGLPVIDVRDVTSAISFGSGATNRRPGYACIGWAAEPTRSYLGYLVPGLGRRRVDATALTEVALRKTTIQVDADAAHKNLGVVRVPHREAGSRHWAGQFGLVEARLGELTDMQETHFGITVTKRPIASVNVLLTFEREQLDRLQRLRALADQYPGGGALGL